MYGRKRSSTSTSRDESNVDESSSSSSDDDSSSTLSSSSSSSYKDDTSSDDTSSSSTISSDDEEVIQRDKKKLKTTISHPDNQNIIQDISNFDIKVEPIAGKGETIVVETLQYRPPTSRDLDNLCKAADKLLARDDLNDGLRKVLSPIKNNQSLRPSPENSVMMGKFFKIRATNNLFKILAKRMTKLSNGRPRIEMLMMVYRTRAWLRYSEIPYHRHEINYFNASNPPYILGNESVNYHNINTKGKEEGEEEVEVKVEMEKEDKKKETNKKSKTTAKVAKTPPPKANPVLAKTRSNSTGGKITASEKTKNDQSMTPSSPYQPTTTITRSRAAKQSASELSSLSATTNTTPTTTTITTTTSTTTPTKLTSPNRSAKSKATRPSLTSSDEQEVNDHIREEEEKQKQKEKEKEKEKERIKRLEKEKEEQERKLQKERERREKEEEERKKQVLEKERLQKELQQKKLEEQKRKKMIEEQEILKQKELLKQREIEKERLQQLHQQQLLQQQQQQELLKQREIEKQQQLLQKQQQQKQSPPLQSPYQTTTTSPPSLRHSSGSTDQEFVHQFHYHQHHHYHPRNQQQQLQQQQSPQQSPQQFPYVPLSTPPPLSPNIQKLQPPTSPLTQQQPLLSSSSSSSTIMTIPSPTPTPISQQPPPPSQQLIQSQESDEYIMPTILEPRDGLVGLEVKRIDGYTRSEPISFKTFSDLGKWFTRMELETFLIRAQRLIVDKLYKSDVKVVTINLGTINPSTINKYFMSMNPDQVISSEDIYECSTPDSMRGKKKKIEVRSYHFINDKKNGKQLPKLYDGKYKCTYHQDENQRLYQIEFKDATFRVNSETHIVMVDLTIQVSLCIHQPDMSITYIPT